MMNCCNCYRTDGKRNDYYYHILAMAAYSNERVAAIVVSVLYRMLTEESLHKERRMYSLNGMHPPFQSVSLGLFLVIQLYGICAFSVINAVDEHFQTFLPFQQFFYSFQFE